MAGQQAAVYNGYVASMTKNNVEPSLQIEGAEVSKFLEANIKGFNFYTPFSHTTRFWSNDSTTRVFKLDDGRIAEFARGSGWAGKVLLAVFDKEEDWFNYRKPMGRFHYFNC